MLRVLWCTYIVCCLPEEPFSLPPPQRIETKERGRRGRGAQPISDNTHSVSPSHTSTSTELDYLSHICSHASRNMKTKKEKETARKRLLRLFLSSQSSRYFSAEPAVKVWKVDQQQTIGGYKHKHTKNGCTLIKSQVDSVKCINWRWCFSVQNKAESLCSLAVDWYRLAWRFAVVSVHMRWSHCACVWALSHWLCQQTATTPLSPWRWINQWN